MAFAPSPASSGWPPRCTRSSCAAGASVVHGVDASVSPVHALVAAGLIGVLAFGWGALRAAGFGAADLMPGWLAVMVRGGVLGAMTLLGLGALAATASLLVHVDDAVTMAQSLHAGVGGGLGLLLAGIAYVPVLAVWASAYVVVGAGVVIGPAVVVSPFIPVTAPTPTARLPAPGRPAAPRPDRWPGHCRWPACWPECSWDWPWRARPAGSHDCSGSSLAVGAAGIAGVVMMVVSYLATGSLGDLRLAHLGPSPFSVGCPYRPAVTLGAVPSAVVARPSDRPSLTVAPVDPDDLGSRGVRPPLDG